MCQDSRHRPQWPFIGDLKEYLALFSIDLCGDKRLEALAIIFRPNRSGNRSNHLWCLAVGFCSTWQDRIERALEERRRKEGAGGWGARLYKLQTAARSPEIASKGVSEGPASGQEPKLSTVPLMRGFHLATWWERSGSCDTTTRLSSPEVLTENIGTEQQIEKMKLLSSKNICEDIYIHYFPQARRFQMVTIPYWTCLRTTTPGP